MAHKPGDVFQITEAHGRAGWIGAFVMATEIKSFGIMGFVSCIESHDEQRQAFIRLGFMMLFGIAMMFAVSWAITSLPSDPGYTRGFLFGIPY